MNYNGFEVFYQNLGNADSIYVRHWENGVPTNILIDGGRKMHVEQIEKFLEDRSKDSPECSSRIHHMVCTHSDDDHVGGLVELVENGNFPINKAWVHDLRNTGCLPSDYKRNLKQWGANRLLAKIESSEQTRLALLEALERRDIEHEDPFRGVQIGPMVVLGPDRDFFNEHYRQLIEEEKARSFETLLEKREVEEYFTEQMQKQADASKELGESETTPINEVSTVILLFGYDASGNYLFTGDVGAAGLTQVIEVAQKYVASLQFLDVPHHGSRRSMTTEQIDCLAPKISFISARGSIKHPSRKLVSALKKHGKVFSTHYSVEAASWLRNYSGNVPTLPTTPAIPLYDRD